MTEVHKNAELMTSKSGIQNPLDPSAQAKKDVKTGADKFQNILENIDKLNKATETLKTQSTSKVKIDMMESEFNEVIGYYIDLWRPEYAEKLLSIKSKFIFNEVPMPQEHISQINEMTQHVQKIYPWEDIKIYYSRDLSSADSNAYWNIQIWESVIWFPIEYDNFMKMDAQALDARIYQDGRLTSYMINLWKIFASWNYFIEELLQDSRAYNYFELYNLSSSGKPIYPENYEIFDKKIYDYLFWKWLLNPSTKFDRWTFYQNYKLITWTDWKILLHVRSNISKDWRSQVIDF